jgi:hypothetical protein
MSGVAVDTTIYCNQLGMLIEFPYCTAVNNGLPCRNIIGCWKTRTDILSFLREHFTDDQLKKVFSTLPKTKIERIIDIISEDN